MRAFDASPQLQFPPKVRDKIAASGARFLVTGAGGWLGRATLEMLDSIFGPELAGQVSAYVRDGRELTLRSGRKLQLRPLSDLAKLHKTPGDTFIAHYAFLTREKLGGTDFAAYIEANRQITSFAVQEAKRLNVAGTFSTSSGAVYKKDGALEDGLQRNPYGFLKLEEEAGFAQLQQNQASRSAVCRVFNLAGPFINKEYALSSLLDAALSGRALSIRAPHRVMRSYAHVRDVVAAGFAVMLGLTSPALLPFDTAGSEVVEVGSLAERIKLVLECPDRVILRPERSSAPEDRYAGDGTFFMQLAREAGFELTSLDEQIWDTARYIHECPLQAAILVP